MAVEKLPSSLTQYRRWRRNTGLKTGSKVIVVSEPHPDALCSCGSPWAPGAACKVGQEHTITGLKPLNDSNPECCETLSVQGPTGAGYDIPYWCVIPA